MIAVDPSAPGPDPRSSAVPPRGVDLLGVREARDGTAGTVLTMACDCGTTTEVELLPGVAQAPVSFEFAYTCDGCESSHWIKIERGETPK